MTNGAIVKLDGRIVLATAYGANPTCLCQDLAFDKEPTPEAIVRASRKWEITHIVEDYRGLVREFVPEARFDNYAPEDDNFAVRVDTALGNEHDIIQFCTQTYDYYVTHSDNPQAVDMDSYLASQGLQKGTQEAEHVRLTEIRRKYLDLTKALDRLVVNENDRRILSQERAALDTYSAFSDLWYISSIDIEIEYRTQFPSGEPDFFTTKEFLLPFFRRMSKQGRELVKNVRSPELKHEIDGKLDDFERMLSEEMEVWKTKKDFKNAGVKFARFFEFEEAKEEQKLLSMGLDPDWIKTYLELGGYPEIEVLRRKYLK